MTDKEKLDVVIKMMHPGYWSASDYRRNAILDALGVDGSKLRWDGNPFEDYLERTIS